MALIYVYLLNVTIKNIFQIYLWQNINAKNGSDNAATLQFGLPGNSW